MAESRHSELTQRAKTARKRALKARQRAEQLRHRGDEYFAGVMENLDTTQELIATNAELAIAGLERDHQLSPLAQARAAAIQAAGRRASQFAKTHRDRGQICRAHFHEHAADLLRIAAKVIERWGSDHEPPLNEADGTPHEQDSLATVSEASAARKRPRAAA